MNTIKLSIEELIFSFYSEGLYEQGISLKEAFFSDINDSELQMMLEIASRSLMAKDMIKEVNGHYKLKDEYTGYIQILSHAECTIQFSKFSPDLSKEEALSIHIHNGKVFAHEVLYDQQIHTINKLSEKEANQLITSRFSHKTLPKDRKIITTLTNENFEQLLEEVSQTTLLSSDRTDKWISQIQPVDADLFTDFINDMFSRKARLDSMLLLTYDNNNNPSVADLCFVIPGKETDWLISKNPENQFNLESASKDFLESFVPSSIFKLRASSF
ncbi:hypothetical protein M4D55_21155 [Metabacillus idriensis]|uniref:Uncharacterized protein n=1 Tax=Metabacillus idriensis TaxID=324768 RepID=A0A6I2MDK9_9BACI|nr:hypothetical protein [Metabacillus idriensis]MCM3598271.1 hypothetical protein [Metabacillus idriensis]MRX55106.1 hypothetical protein [Metabacillus idriensis]OHR71827.1 hypothetical protein HMPREF3291_23640 [Bacillus sp. HMSC76G11]